MGRWRALSGLMAFGAAYDLVFGISIVLIPSVAARLLGIEIPADPFYLRLNGVFLLILSGLYALPAIRPERFHPIAPVSAVGRLAGCLVFAAAWRQGRPAVFLVLGLADLAIGLATALAWIAARRSSPSA